MAVDDRKVVPDSYGCGQTGVGWVRWPGKSVKVPMVIGTCDRSVKNVWPDVSAGSSVTSESYRRHGKSPKVTLVVDRRCPAGNNVVRLVSTRVPPRESAE